MPPTTAIFSSKLIFDHLVQHPALSHRTVMLNREVRGSIIASVLAIRRKLMLNIWIESMEKFNLVMSRHKKTGTRTHDGWFSDYSKQCA